MITLFRRIFFFCRKYPHLLDLFYWHLRKADWISQNPNFFRWWFFIQHFTVINTCTNFHGVILNSILKERKKHSVLNKKRKDITLCTRFFIETNTSSVWRKCLYIFREIILSFMDSYQKFIEKWNSFGNADTKSLLLYLQNESTQRV